MAVGLSLAFQKVHIWYPAVVIGIVAGILTAVGMNLGKRFGPLLGKRMEVIGGLVQIIIGIKILWEHLGA